MKASKKGILVRNDLWTSMKNRKGIIIGLLLLIAPGCISESGDQELSLAEELINDAVNAHGGQAYENIALSFKFREYNYTWEESAGAYKYTRQLTLDSTNTVDTYENGLFKRTTNGVVNNLSTEMMDKYSSSINSVIYFLALPYKLLDDAVKAEYKGEFGNYHGVAVTFTEEGGGDDFEDEYFYWFNKETKEMDFFAYNYRVNGGGARFRAAYNPRRVSGILFKDYVNYEASLEIPLQDLLELYEKDSLKELSRIETEEIKPL
ncbi:MAG: hypothetical protein MK078_08025 [Crocinitomicaceae bacterium]|nr:hypothetical protein [Crocinitomicaceae bacterium]